MKVISMSEAQATTKPVLTKEERIAKIEAQIATLTQKLDDVRNDRVPQGKAKKAVYAPAVGDKVLATTGRTTATTQAVIREGVVVAVKTPAEGEKGATQVRVQIGEGFDAQLVTLYPAQLVKVEEKAEDDGISNAPLGSLV